MGAVLGCGQGGREGDRGEFLILQSTSHLIILLVPPSEGAESGDGEGVVCVEVWVRQWWAVAAGSWALTHVLQLQPEL